MKLFISLVITALLAMACNNSKNENIVPANGNDASIIFGDKNETFSPLVAPAKTQAVYWGVLEDFLTEAKNANGTNYQGLRNHSERLREYSDSLFKNIPDTLNTRPINSRLMVLKTRSALLYQASHQSNIDSAKVQESLNNLNTAVNNLIVQLNEKFQKDNIDFQRREDERNELKKQKRFQDSILNLELQDKNNRKL
tara:strand:+ start:497 stop:1087 length:591 start_codon:yes stop_codon:yes gene_type:complete